MDCWEIDDPKIDLADIVAAAERKGPQRITKDGLEMAIVLSMPDYKQLKKGEPLSEFFRRSPLAQGELDLNRNRN